MDTLVELVNLVTRKRIKKVELFDESSRNKNSHYYKLFSGIHQHKYHSDEEAAADLYDCQPSEKKYLILKTRLKQKLLNTLFFLDHERERFTSESEAAQADCKRILYQVEVLWQNQSYKLVLPLLEKILKKAEDFELTQPLYEASRYMLQLAAQQQNLTEYRYYQQQVDKYQQRWLAEEAATAARQDLHLLYTKSRIERDELQQIANAHTQKIERAFQQFGGIRLEQDLLRTQALSQRIRQQYQAERNTLNQQAAAIQAHRKFFALPAVEEVYLAQMNNMLHLRLFEDIERFYNTLPEGLQLLKNWFAAQEYRILTALHTQHYVEGAQIFQEATRQPQYRRLEAEDKERWNIYQAYFHYLYKAEQDRDIREMIHNTKIPFRVHEFIDRRPPFSKSRRHLNIAILSAQLLFYLEKMDLRGMSDCIDAIEPYSRRYPKQDTNYRSECFIHLLTELRQADFRYYQTQRNTEKTWAELQHNPMSYHGGNRGLEVLPYEAIWHTILERIKQERFG